MESFNKTPVAPDYRLPNGNFDRSNLIFRIGQSSGTRQNDSVSLVIPAYNEEKRIRPFLEEINIELPDSWEIIVVCDGTDSTANIVRSFGGRFNVLESAQRLGKGGAVLEGFKHAKGKIVGYVDADGAISSSEIIKVVNSVRDNNEVAIGSRWIKGARIVSHQPILRVVLGRLYHYLSFSLLGLRMKDTQCGIKAFNSVLVKGVMGSVTLRNLSFDTAILYHCNKHGAKITEVPVIWNDVEGSKVHPIKAPLIMFFSLVGIRLAHSKSSKKLGILFESVRDLFENA